MNTVQFVDQAPASFGTLVGVIVVLLFIACVWAIRRMREEETFPVKAGETSLTVPARGRFWGWFSVGWIGVIAIFVVLFWMKPSWFLRGQGYLHGTNVTINGGPANPANPDVLLFPETGTTVKWVDKKSKDGGFLIVDLGKSAKRVRIAREAMLEPMEAEVSGKFSVKRDWGEVPSKLFVVVQAKDGKETTKEIASVMVAE